MKHVKISQSIFVGSKIEQVIVSAAGCLLWAPFLKVEITYLVKTGEFGIPADASSIEEASTQNTSGELRMIPWNYVIRREPSRICEKRKKKRLAIADRLCDDREDITEKAEKPILLRNAHKHTFGQFIEFPLKHEHSFAHIVKMTTRRWRSA